MKGFRIVVEGKSDVKFLQDFIAEHFNMDLAPESFIKNGGNALTEGKNVLDENKSVNNIRASIAAGSRVVLLFDADAEIKKTRDYLSGQKEKYQIEFETFLFPNDQDSGNLETLLRKVVADSKEPIFKCIEGYSSCLSQTKVDHLREFDAKTQVYVFVDSFDIGGEGKEEKRDYREKQLWNLHHDYLEPLKVFLKPYFENQ